MENSPIHQSPKRFALGRYLGSLTMIQSLFAKGRQRTRRQPAPRTDARVPESKQERLHEISANRHDPISRENPAPDIEAMEATAREDNPQSPETLEELANKPATVLYEATTVFPFTFFPDTITVDTEQIKIQHKEFFYVKNVNSINHEDILNVTAESGPVFATLKIATRFFAAEQLTISKLWKKDAFELRYIIHGLMAARHRGVEIESSDKQKLKEMLKEVGDVGPHDAQGHERRPGKPAQA